MIQYDSTGTFNVTLIASSENGTDTLTLKNYITVNNYLPISILIKANADSLCAGTSVTFTATPVNGGHTFISVVCKWNK